MRRAPAIVTAAAAALCACGDGTGDTGIDLSIRYDPELGLERFALVATAGGEPLIERTLLPDDQRPLSESGREGVLLLVPDAVPGGQVAVRVDGLVRGEVIASGEVTVRIAAGELTDAEVTVRPGAAGCGEWDWAPSNVTPCQDGPEPDGALLVDGAGTWRLDTGAGQLTTPDGDILEPASDMVGQGGGVVVRMLAVDELVVESGAVLEVVGPHPLAIVVWGEASIAGAIDVTAGGGTADCTAADAGERAGNDVSGAGGGGGGGFGGDGGDGGDGHGDQKGAKGAKGSIAGDAMLTPLRGGCPGGDGGDAFGAAGSGGAGGRGGGAIQIAARDALLVGGSIRAAGDGGAGGSAASSGGGGGGSGGAILLEAPTIRLQGDASVCANGGSGGEGSGTDDAGSDGASGTCTDERAMTANLSPDGGDGGRGSAGDDDAGENGKAGREGGAGGGGGGGIGRVRLRAIDDLIDLGALITPAAG